MDAQTTTTGQKVANLAAYVRESQRIMREKTNDVLADFAPGQLFQAEPTLASDCAMMFYHLGHGAAYAEKATAALDRLTGPPPPLTVDDVEQTADSIFVREGAATVPLASLPEDRRQFWIEKWQREGRVTK